MIGPDVIVRHLLAFLVPCGFAVFVFLATRVTHVFWFRLSGVVLAVFTFYFTMMIMNRLLFANVRTGSEAEADPSLEPIEQR